MTKDEAIAALETNEQALLIEAAEMLCDRDTGYSPFVVEQHLTRAAECRELADRLRATNDCSPAPEPADRTCGGVLPLKDQDGRELWVGDRFHYAGAAVVGVYEVTSAYGIAEIKTISGNYLECRASLFVGGSSAKRMTKLS